MSFETLIQPWGDAAGERIVQELESGHWNSVLWAVAFAKVSGVQYVDGPLRAFTQAGNTAELGVGIDHRGTSFEAVSQLAAAVATKGRLVIVKDVMPFVTFHPKVYLFRTVDEHDHTTAALLLSGSSNLTKGGLFDNHEFCTVWRPDLSDPDQRKRLDDIESNLERWLDTEFGLAVAVDEELLFSLNTQGRLPSEADIAAESKTSGTGRKKSTKKAALPKALKKLERPSRSKKPPAMGLPLVALPGAFEDEGGKAQQRTRSRQRKRKRGGSPNTALCIDVSNTKMTELYLAKAPLDDDPLFFGHPFTGLTKPKLPTSDPQPERDPRPMVDISLYDAAGNRINYIPDHALKIWQYANGKKANQDIRITVPAPLLRSLPKDCLVEMRQSPIRNGLDYELDFLTPGSKKYDAARIIASTPLPGGKRRWGWR